MTTDTGLIYQLALGEGDQYAAAFASILNRYDDDFDVVTDDDFTTGEADF